MVTSESEARRPFHRGSHNGNNYIIIIIKQTKISNNFLRKIKIDTCENEPTKRNCYCYRIIFKKNH